MSDQNTGTRGAAGEPSEEEIREYVQQLRSAPVDQVASEIIFGLLNAAQAKLGRRDGRLLIDGCALLAEHFRAHVAAELTDQVDQIVRQLQLGQVQAESQIATRGEAEPNDLAEEPARPGNSAPAQAAGTSEPAPASAQTSSQPTPSSRLLIPGRDF